MNCHPNNRRVHSTQHTAHSGKQSSVTHRACPLIMAHCQADHGPLSGWVSTCISDLLGAYNNTSMTRSDLDRFPIVATVAVP
jgi:hypothetical protein